MNDETELTPVLLVKAGDRTTHLVPCCGSDQSSLASNRIQITLLAESFVDHAIEPEIRDEIEIDGECYTLLEVTKRDAGYTCVGSHSPIMALSRARTIRM
ncbi:MAG: hypothetical protein ABI591_15465 [Kofleriaceae bacterium]